MVDRVATEMDDAGLSFGHGTDNAHDEAVWLVLWRLGLPLDDLDGVAERELSASEINAIQDLIRQRITTRKPAAYLTQEAWLQGLSFFVDERVIVPRSMIAEPMLDGGLGACLPTPPRRVLDLCTGNASLAVLAALTWPDAAVDASDLSADALAVAAINLERHAVQARVRLLQADGLTGLTGPYDLILCNPPYVNADAMAALPAEYRAEPALALAGGSDGMDFVRALLRDAPTVLAPTGSLLLEIGHERAHFEAAFPHLSPLWLSCSAGDDHLLLLGAAELHPFETP